jgi:hypothetical protein
MRLLLFLSLTVVAIGPTACGGRNGDTSATPLPETTQATPETQAAPAQDEWVTIEGVDFPLRMARAPAEVQEAYVFAAKHPEVLQYMPCYCGCEREHPPHQANIDCFVDQIDRSGERPRITIDPMGFG